MYRRLCIKRYYMLREKIYIFYRIIIINVANDQKLKKIENIFLYLGNNLKYY